MKKGLLSFPIFALIMLLVCGCKDNKVGNLAEKIVGKWMAVERDGTPLLTNMSHTITFLSATEAYASTSWIELVDMDNESNWSKIGKSQVSIKGKKLIKTIQPNAHVLVVDEMKVTSINDTDMYGVSELETFIDGIRVTTTKFVCHYVKITEDYEDDILGVWEGRVTSEMGSDYNDTEQHRWEFLPDGTYRFYRKVNGQWLLNDEFAHYFVDGTMICCRWKNIGLSEDEHREWWNITMLENGVMTWTAMRERPDGATYISTLTMEKVD